MIYKYNIVEKVAGNSKHHLFDYYEVRTKLISLFGEPNSDKEHNLLHKRIKLCMNNIPVFIIKKDFHNEYHKRIKSNRVINRR